MQGRNVEEGPDSGSAVTPRGSANTGEETVPEQAAPPATATQGTASASADATPKAESEIAGRIAQGAASGAAGALVNKLWDLLRSKLSDD